MAVFRETPVFTAGTQCVALQLSRFHTTDRRVLKSRSPVSLPNTVRLPVWVAGRVQQLLFHLCSALIHLGHTPNSDSGHYRAVLIGSDNLTGLPMMTLLLGRAVTADLDVILRNVYVVFLFLPVLCLHRQSL